MIKIMGEGKIARKPIVVQYSDLIESSVKEPTTRIGLPEDCGKPGDKIVEIPHPNHENRF